MTDSMDERRRALEEEYFKKQNEAALKRLQQRKADDTARKSPITGKPMEQVTFMGINIDRCNDSGGIWLDSGELEQIIKASKETKDKSFMDNLWSFLGNK